MEKQTLTFADQEIANRLASRKHFLKDVDQLLDWKRINKLISKVEIRRTSVAGRDAYSAEVMFRIMLVQAWYKLSDYQNHAEEKEESGHAGGNQALQLFCIYSEIPG